MRGRNLLILAAVAVLLLALAWVARRSQPEARTEVAVAGQAFLPGFLDRVNEVRRIELRKGDEHLVLERTDAGWVAPEHAGYPVKPEQVRQLLLQAARLQTLEAKTSNPELFDRLEVEDPDAEAARSGRVDFYGDGEEPLASLIVGKMNWGKRKSVYVRRPGENQAWECQGELRVETSTSVWMDRQIARLEADKVQWVEVRHPDGEVLRIHRAAQGDPFTVDGVPEGRELQTPRAGDQVAGALAWISFDEVRRAADMAPAGETVVTVFHTFDGLEVQVESWEAEGKTWARFRAVPPPAPEAEAASEAAGEEAAEAEAAEEQSAEEPADQAAEESGTQEEKDHEKDHEKKDEKKDGKKDEKKEKDPAEQAREWNEKWEPWVFALPSYKADALRRHLEDLLKKPEEAAPAGDQEEAAPAGDQEEAPPAGKEQAPPAGGGSGGGQDSSGS